MSFREWLGRALMGLPPGPVQDLSEVRDGLIAWQNQIATSLATARCSDDDIRDRMGQAAHASQMDWEEQAAGFELERQRLLRRGYQVAHLALPPMPHLEPFIARAEQREAEHEVDDWLEDDWPRRLQ